MQQLEAPRRGFRGHEQLGSIRGHSAVTTPPGSGAAMAAARAAGLEGHGRAAGATQGRKVNLSQRVQELHAIIALQGAAPLASQGRAGGALGPSLSSCLVPTVP